MERKRHSLRTRRVVYHGNLYYAARKVIENVQTLGYYKDVLRIYVNRHTPSAYKWYNHWVKDIPIADVTEDYSDNYTVVYKGQSFYIDSIYINTQEVRLTTGDNYGELQKEMKQIGALCEPYERGYIYFVHLPYNMLEHITQTHFDYKTNQKTVSQITPQQFWQTTLAVFGEEE